MLTGRTILLLLSGSMLFCSCAKPDDIPASCDPPRPGGFIKTVSVTGAGTQVDAIIIAHARAAAK